jgi:predicted transcriptional regulator
MFTSREIAESLGRHPVTIRKAVAEGRVECTRVIGRVFFTEEQARAIVQTIPAKPKS